MKSIFSISLIVIYLAATVLFALKSFRSMVQEEILIKKKFDTKIFKR